MRSLPVPSSGRWNAEVAQGVLAQLDRSGMSVAAFAAAHHLDPQRLHAWRRRLQPPAPRFVEVVRREQPAAEPIEVVCPSGHVVRVGIRSLELLGPVLEILERSC